MAADDENRKKDIDQITELLKKHYKPEHNIDANKFVSDVLDKINSLFHKEICSEKSLGDNNEFLSEEQRYWLGLDEYINNRVNALKHKTVTEHLLKCKECRKNYNDLTDKKKVNLESNSFYKPCLV